MYESFYRLKEKPFNLTPDPDYVYMSPGHENAFTHLEYAIRESKGFVVITGEVGSGKTTLINFLLRQVPQEVNVGIINNTFIQPEELLKTISLEFEIPVDGADKSVLLTRLYGYLLEKFAKKERVVLIIDEAQNLPERTLEEIRMLSNLESEKHHLIQMILVGQPQLKDKLQKKSLEQFVQRVTVYCHLDALDKVEVNKYVHHRLEVAGAEDINIFDENAMRAVYKHSQGIPRLINIICDAALVYGYADDVTVIGRDIIEAVVEARKIEKSERSEELEGAAEETAMRAAASQSAAEYGTSIERKLEEMQVRIAEMDAVVSKMKSEMDAFGSGQEKKDKMILKLLKMLKKNMEHRMKLVMQIAELRERFVLDRGQPPEKSKEVIQSLLAIIKKK